MQDLPLAAVEQLLRLAAGIGFGAAYGDGPLPTMEIRIEDVRVWLVIRARFSAGRRNPGDVQGGIVEWKAVVEGDGGAERAIEHLRHGIEAYRGVTGG